MRGRHRGQTGWIHGELGRLHPAVSKAHVFFGERLAVLPIANLAPGRTEPESAQPSAAPAQLELAL